MKVNLQYIAILFSIISSRSVYSSETCPNFFEKMWLKTMDAIDGTTGRIKDAESLGFKVKVIQVGPDYNPHKGFELSEFPDNTSMGRVMKSAQEKLGVKFVYDPLEADGKGYGFYSPKNNTIYLSSHHFKDKEAVLNTNILHEIRHAHFNRKMHKGENNIYLSELVSTSNKPYITVEGYGNFLDTSELATTERDLAYAQKSFGKVASLKPFSKDELIKSYAERLLQISNTIEKESKSMLEGLKSKKQKINWTVDRSITNEATGHPMIYAELPINNPEGEKIASFRVYLPDVQADTPDENAEAMLEKYFDDLLIVTEKHKQQAQTALKH
jgi:hypothetical protein